MINVSEEVLIIADANLFTRALIQKAYNNRFDDWLYIKIKVF